MSPPRGGRAGGGGGRGRPVAGRGRPGGPVRKGHAGARVGQAEPDAEGSRSSGPRGLGGEQVEGRQAVRELLLAGKRRVRDIWMAEDLDDAPVLGDIRQLAEEARVVVKRVPRTVLDHEARSEAPQGVLAHAAPLREVEFESLCKRRRDRVPFLLVLDGITDPQNVGALLRTAAGAGVTGVVLPRHRAAHVTPTVTKAAAGAVEHLSLALVPGVPAALARAKELGVWVVGLDGAGDSSLFDLAVATEPVALVLGAEGSGLGRLTRARCDVLASIPMHGPLASLNVAAAGALACFEVTRRRAAVAPTD